VFLESLLHLKCCNCSSQLWELSLDQQYIYHITNNTPWKAWTVTFYDTCQCRSIGLEHHCQTRAHVLVDCHFQPCKPADVWQRVSCTLFSFSVRVLSSSSKENIKTSTNDCLQCIMTCLLAASAWDPFIEFTPAGFRGFGFGTEAVCGRTCSWYNSLSDSTRASLISAATDPSSNVR
jgi:hypothetical protein